MKKMVTTLATVALLAGTVSAEVSKEVLNSISTPNEVKTSIGTLKFLDGAPYPETAEKVYDYVDTMRGVDAFLKGIPGASLHMLIHAARVDVGAKELHQVMIFDKLMEIKKKGDYSENNPIIHNECGFAYDDRNIRCNRPKIQCKGSK